MFICVVKLFQLRRFLLNIVKKYAFIYPCLCCNHQFKRNYSRVRHYRRNHPDSAILNETFHCKHRENNVSSMVQFYEDQYATTTLVSSTQVPEATITSPPQCTTTCTSTFTPVFVLTDALENDGPDGQRPRPPIPPHQN